MVGWRLMRGAVLLSLASAAGCGPSDPEIAGAAGALGSMVDAGPRPSLTVTFRDPSHRILGLDRDGTLYGTSYADSAAALYVSTDGRTWTRRASKTVEGTPSIMTPLSDGTLLLEAKLDGFQSLWRSTDHGVTWTQVLYTGKHRMLQTHSIRELDGTVFYGEYQSFSSDVQPINLWRSADRGATWSVAHVFTDRRHVHSLVADPGRQELWALSGDGAQGGLLRSRDRGLTFEVVVDGYNGVAVDAVVTPEGLLFGTDTIQEPYPPRISLVAPDGSQAFLATLTEPSYSILAVAGGGYLLGTTRETSSEYALLDSAYLYASSDGFTWHQVAGYRADDLTQYGRVDVHWQLPGGEVIIELANVDGMPQRGGYLLARLSLEEPGPVTHEISFQHRRLPTTSYTGARDAWISENAPTTRYGTSTRVRFDGDDPEDTGRDAYGLLRWDVTAIPATSVVTAVSVTLQVTDAGSRPFELYALLRSFTEAEVTWNERRSGYPWQLAGARGTLDRSSTVLGAATPTATGSYSFNLNAAGVAVVQTWVNDPPQNRGLVIADPGNLNGVNVVSRETSTTSLRPKLTVTYQTP